MIHRRQVGAIRERFVCCTVRGEDADPAVYEKILGTRWLRRSTPIIPLPRNFTPYFTFL